MRRVRWWWVGVLALGGCWTAVAADRTPPATIWSGTSGGATVVWSKDDVVVHRGALDAEVVFSARAEADRGWRKATTTETRSCSEDRKVQVLSVVGPLVSLSIEADGNCEGAAHPYASHRWSVFDVGRIERGRPLPVRLTALVPESELVAKLAADPLVRKALGAKANPPPQTLTDLFAELAEQPIRVGACDFDFGDDQLNAFAIYGLKGGDRMAIRIALPYRYEVCRGQIAQLGLDLPLPDHLRAELVQAAGRRSGFLLQDLKAVAAGRQTTFRLATPAAPSVQ